MTKKPRRKSRGLTQLDVFKKAHPDVYAVWRSEKPKARYMTREDFERISSTLHRQNWPEDYRN